MDNLDFGLNSPAGKMGKWAKKDGTAGNAMNKHNNQEIAKRQSEAMDKMMATALGNEGPVETFAPKVNGDISIIGCREQRQL